MITINAVLFGVLATLFVEMALVIIFMIIVPRVHAHNRKSTTTNTRKTEVRNNG